MCKFIRFKLIKDRPNRQIIFIPLEYNQQNRFNHKSIDIDFKNKKAKICGSWTGHFISNTKLSISINSPVRNGGTKFRDSARLNSEYELLRVFLEAEDMDKEFFLPLVKDDDIDIIYDNIINAFKILSQKV